MLTLDEMADQLGVSAGTVKTWHHAGLVSEVPRGFRTVHPIGWTSGKVK
jgi:predicted site-specific integrase-resolvase